VNFAVRLKKEGGSRETQNARAFQLAFGRAPSADEAQTCLTHWTKMAERHRTIPMPPPVRPREVVREASEEVTGEKFSFTEVLESAGDFVPDVGMNDVDAETRGLAEVCLVLLNANEFSTVD
jgi:hypothetical protein